MTAIIFEFPRHDAPNLTDFELSDFEIVALATYARANGISILDAARQALSRFSNQYQGRGE